MNIFYLHTNPYEAVKFMVDRHAKGGKMICESASMLANCYTKEQLVKAPTTQTGNVRNHSWYNHPCSKWARASTANFNWLLNHAVALIIERHHRTKKGHFTTDFILWCANNTPKNIEDSDKLTTPALAMPDYCKLDDPVLSYRKYYNEEKRHLFSWTNRPTPYWIVI